MHRDTPPSSFPDPTFRMPIPPHSPPHTTSNNNLDDIFGDVSPPSSLPPTADDLPAQNRQRPHPSADPSDIPRLRSIHVTAGYRDGIASSKAAYVQEGFDEGLSLGAVLGRRVGYVLGVLEGMVIALRRERRDGNRGGEQNRGNTGEEVNEVEVSERQRLVDDTRRLYAQAQDELKLEKVFGRDYFDEEGSWSYKIERAEEDTTFEVVADTHPLLKSWEIRVADLAKKWNIDLAAVEKDAPRDDGEG